jgi:hypothetical protein
MNTHADRRGGGQGKLVLERYAGNREIKKDTLLFSASTCKSVSNAFFGLRVADGALNLTTLVEGPGWDKAEVRRRNMTRALPHCARHARESCGVTCELPNV